MLIDSKKDGMKPSAKIYAKVASITRYLRGAFACPKIVSLDCRIEEVIIFFKKWETEIHGVDNEWVGLFDNQLCCFLEIWRWKELYDGLSLEYDSLDTIQEVREVWNNMYQYEKNGFYDNTMAVIWAQESVRSHNRHTHIQQTCNINTVSFKN